MIHPLRPVALALSLCSLLPTAACVINGDDDDDAGDSSDGGSSPSTSNTTNPSTSDPSASASNSDPSASASDSLTAGTASATATATATDTATATVTETASDSLTDSASITDSDTADESGESGVDVDPQDGVWEYQELPGTMNECTFIEEPSNGFGAYMVANTGGGTFTITPGDGTDPFQCTRLGGAFECAERLSGTYDIGMGLGDASGDILVGIDGSLDSATEMNGEQVGRIECNGTDCGLAEDALGVTFPCAFTIPFFGEAQ